MYPSYCTQYGCETNAHDGKTVTLAPGATSTVNVTASYIVPADGLLSATVSVTGAPAGTSDTVAFTTCPSGASTTSCQTFYGTPGSATSFILANGVWVVTPYYLASPFDNAVPGPSESVTITGGRTTTVSLSVAYRVPGTAAGSIDVTGAPANIPITSYTVVACPASAPLSVNNPSLECASEYSGPAGFGFGAADRTAKTANAQPVPVTIAPVTAGSATPASQAPAGYQGPASAPYDVYQITSLTPGKWLLYPGYQTELGSYTATVGTPVTVVAGHKVTHTLFVPYQHPMVGAVAGQVVVLDAPANGYEAGVEACTAIPTASSCPGEQEAFVASGGAYELDLAPGVWWLSGFVDEFGVLGQSQLVSAPRQVTVAAGSILTETFVVQGS